VKAIHGRHVWGSGLRAGLTLVISHNLNVFTSTFKSNPLRGTCENKKQKDV